MSGHNVGTYQGNELAHNSSKNACLQLSQLAEPPWTDPGFESEIGGSQLIITKIIQKNHKQTAQMETDSSKVFPYKSSYTRKMPSPPPPPLRRECQNRTKQMSAVNRIDAKAFTKPISKYRV